MTARMKVVAMAMGAALAVAGMGLRAENPAATAGDSAAAAGAQIVSNPADRVRHQGTWEFGPFLNGGNGVGDRSDYHFAAAGFQVGRVMTPVLKAGILSGQFELGANLMGPWVAVTPDAHTKTFQCPGGRTCSERFSGGTYYGVGGTPLILRWNFATKSRKVLPWFQAAGGLIYTTDKFPPEAIVPKGQPGETSQWNFAPQGGAGLHYFVKPGRSIDLGINAVHISSASLGDKNPGVNASMTVQIGYTVWK